jgi:hypothetical protein
VRLAFASFALVLAQLALGFSDVVVAVGPVRHVVLL